MPAPGACAPPAFRTTKFPPGPGRAANVFTTSTTGALATTSASAPAPTARSPCRPRVTLCAPAARPTRAPICAAWTTAALLRSEEHTSELQSRGHLVCRLLLEKKKPEHRDENAHNENSVHVMLNLNYVTWLLSNSVQPDIGVEGIKKDEVAASKRYCMISIAGG